MPREASGRLKVLLQVEEAETLLGSANRRSALPHEIDFDYALGSGTSDGQIDRVWSDEASYTTTPTDYDLVGSSVISELSGDAVSLVEIVGIVIQNTSVAGNLLVGGDANAIPIFSAANDVIVIPPGGIFVWFAPAGTALVAGTGDILQVAASTGTVTGKIAVFGRSA